MNEANDKARLVFLRESEKLKIIIRKLCPENKDRQKSLDYVDVAMGWADGSLRTEIMKEAANG